MPEPLFARLSTPTKIHGRDEVDRVRAKEELRHDSEVPGPCASQSPEEIGFALLVAHAKSAVGRHDLDPDDVVAGEPEGPRGVAVATAEREPCDTHLFACAEGHGTSDIPQAPVDGAELRPGCDPGRPVGPRVDVREARHIEHEARCGREPGEGVPT